MTSTEQLMDALWLASEQNKSVANAQWSFSSAFYTRLKADVTPSCDPFGARGDSCMGLPYIVKAAQVEPFILQGAV